ncbi:MAG: hypothetical protein C5B58_01320 [Acidobacteria bacterium]|nr:MAG: hypothetical protein C5B58_01320 [Acidobacteriota bacterium]
MSTKHLDKEDRLEQHFRRLGTHEPRCVICGQSDPRCLHKHHIAGHRYHSDTVIVCQNCHSTLSDDQLDHTRRGQEPPKDKLTVVGLFLLGLCALLILVVQRMREFGDWLIYEAPRAGVTA